MDWQSTCRICLENKRRNMVSFYDWDVNNEQLGDKYTGCCGVEVLENDNLPTLLCLNCVDRLTDAYHFKQLCLNSNKILRECLEEFTAIVSAEKDTETIIIKQENGSIIQYELPEERHRQGKRKTPNVFSKAQRPMRKGRRRKYPDEQELSPYQFKKSKRPKKEPKSLTTLLSTESIDVKVEAIYEDADEIESEADNPEYICIDEPTSEPVLIEETQQASIGGKSCKGFKKKLKTESRNEGDEIVSTEKTQADSETISEHIDLKPKTEIKKKYNYGKKHRCDICNASFTSNALLQAHVNRHLGIKPFVCNICDYSCVLNMELRRHMKVHTGERPYKCRMCERRFGDFGSRQKHERVHMGVRPYMCSLCDKSFTYSYVLANHMLLHTGEKRYSCEPCNRKFARAFQLTFHNKLHHKELYLKQQKERDAKKARLKINVTKIDTEDDDLQLVEEEDTGDES